VIEIYSGDHIDTDLAYLQANPEYKLGDDGVIWAFLDQIANSENATWKLKEWSAVSQNPNFNAKAITWMQTAGFNIYRIRPLSQRLQKYRILYAYNARRDEVYLLAIVIKPPRSLHPSNCFSIEIRIL